MSTVYSGCSILTALIPVSSADPLHSRLAIVLITARTFFVVSFTAVNNVRGRVMRSRFDEPEPTARNPMGLNPFGRNDCHFRTPPDQPFLRLADCIVRIHAQV